MNGTDRIAVADDDKLTVEVSHNGQNCKLRHVKEVYIVGGAYVVYTSNCVFTFPVERTTLDIVQG